MCLILKRLDAPEKRYAGSRGHLLRGKRVGVQGITLGGRLGWGQHLVCK